MNLISRIWAALCRWLSGHSTDESLQRLYPERIDSGAISYGAHTLGDDEPTAEFQVAALSYTDHDTDAGLALQLSTGSVEPMTPAVMRTTPAKATRKRTTTKARKKRTRK